MKLFNGTIRPGIVTEVLGNGVIKASAPGLFNFSDDPNMAPPIMPWFIGCNSHTYSQPKVYDDVWIMNFSDNPRQLYWFRKDRVEDQDNLGTEILTEKNVEILCNRDVAGEWCTIYFSDGSGWVIAKGESIIQIRADGSIVLDIDMDKRCIDINPTGISIGSYGKSSHTAAYGDEVVKAFKAIVAGLKQIQMTAAAFPPTAHMAASIGGTCTLIEECLPRIESPHVTLE